MCLYLDSYIYITHIYIYIISSTRTCDCLENALVLRVPELVLQKYAGHHSLKDATKKLSDELDVIQAVKSFHTGVAKPSSSSATTTDTRTLANPEWEGALPHNVRKQLALTAVPTSSFESSTTWLGLNIAWRYVFRSALL